MDNEMRYESEMSDAEYYGIDEDGWTVIGSFWVNLETGAIVTMPASDDGDS